MATEKKILNALGVLLVFGLIILIIRILNKKTETKLYSDDAYTLLQDSDKVSELDRAVSNYHRNGKWSNEKVI